MRRPSPSLLAVAAVAVLAVAVLAAMASGLALLRRTSPSSQRVVLQAGDQEDGFAGPPEVALISAVAGEPVAAWAVVDRRRASVLRSVTADEGLTALPRFSVWAVEGEKGNGPRITGLHTTSEPPAPVELDDLASLPRYAARRFVVATHGSRGDLEAVVAAFE